MARKNKGQASVCELEEQFSRGILCHHSDCYHGLTSSVAFPLTDAPRKTPVPDSDNATPHEHPRKFGNPLNMIEIGSTYHLEVVKQTEFGFYLDAENLGEILLPTKHAPDDLNIDDQVEVFLYLDSDDRPIATTQIPKAEVGEFAYLEVKDNTPIGAFLDWGLDKDVLVPFAEQHRPMNVGDSYIVFLYLDNQGRITATSKIDKIVLEDDQHDFRAQQVVDLLIGNSTELGWKAIVDQSHWGLLYKDEVDQRLSFGLSIQGYVKHVRADGKIDLSLKSGQQIRDEYSQVIQDYLRDHDGFAPVHDKSTPAQIFALFGMSKGQFKNTIGGLYKQKLISIDQDGIRLI
ncbi:CvfB family protein [Allorhodopirellula heiligendammensis]|uniref:CvfB family protein n=1 Tax=Allorhodopirellula heiligendammensis TaxID=2714739 RepID=UPI00266051DB|nr:S1-like domain-containing RNA-binding protein [Allorhodopirellula heiligendammensis]